MLGLAHIIMKGVQHVSNRGTTKNHRSRATRRTGTRERSTIGAASRSSQGASVVIVREPIVGWRQWNFMYPHFLANLGNDTIYVPREKIEAHCEQYSTLGTSVLPKDHSGQQAPHLTCTCGIHAYKEKPRLLREIRNKMTIPAIYSGR